MADDDHPVTPTMGCVCVCVGGGWVMQAVVIVSYIVSAVPAL